MGETTRNKTQQDKAEREAAERRRALRERVLLWATLLGGLIVLVAIFANSKPQKSLVCDGRGASLHQFGTCR